MTIRKRGHTVIFPALDGDSVLREIRSSVQVVVRTFDQVSDVADWGSFTLSVMPDPDLRGHLQMTVSVLCEQED